jgi:diguanylate cyclase (GGDEF)-like protein
MKKNHLVVRRIETTILVTLIGATFFIMDEFEIAERAYQYSRDHENYQLDEIVLTIAMSFLYLSIFTIRRYIELLRSQRLAITDQVTQVLNRSGGSQLLEKTLNKQRTADAENAIIYFDIDDFKQVNDKFGHNVGDEVIKNVCQLCNAQLRSTDKLIRWGGEEFLILCQNTNLNEASRLAERIRKTLAETKVHKIPTVTASFGVALLEMDLPLDDSINVADKRLYSSKNTGKNCVTTQESINE